jgi:hypothetical protein
VRRGACQVGRSTQGKEMTLKISDDEDGHPRIEADGIAASLKSCGEERSLVLSKGGGEVLRMQ